MGDPPFSCNKEGIIALDDPDFPIPVRVVHEKIREETIRRLKAKIAPYTEIDPETGKEVYRRMHQPQINEALREVEEWERRVKDRAEKYIEVYTCPGVTGLVIRAKYIDLIW